MLDIKFIRENAEAVKANCKRRKYPADIDTILEIDADIRKLTREIDEMRAERNRLSKLCGADPEARERVKAMKSTLAEKEELCAERQKKLSKLISYMPNMLADDVPDGDDDSGNVELRKEGTIREFNFKVRDHQELGELCDILDIARGAKVAQSGFYYWKGKGAMLAQALYFWVQKELVAKGFTMFMTPCAAKERTLFGTGYLPFFADQTYSLKDEDLALIGTSEQTLVGYHTDDLLNADELPLKYTAFTPCFRTESEMPLAECSSPIAGLFEHIGNRILLRRYNHCGITCSHICSRLAPWIFASEQRISRRGTCRGDGMRIGKTQTVRSQPVGIGCTDTLCTIASKVTESQVIGIYKHHIRPQRLFLSPTFLSLYKKRRNKRKRAYS